jgi:transcriptional regulator with XRE-family HTH domain
MSTKFDDYWKKQREEAGERLKSERIRLGFNQADFAERLGIHRNTQRNYESGTREPDAEYYKAAATLGVNLPFVINGVNIQELPAMAAQIANLVFSRYNAGFQPEALSDLFFILSLGKLEEGIAEDEVLPTDYIDSLIKMAVERGDVFNEACRATSLYASDLVHPKPEGPWNVKLWIELIFETIELYDEFRNRLAGLSLPDNVRLAAQGVVKNHGGMRTQN